MKILLVGNGDRNNRGCEAISISTIELLRKYIENIEIEILSFNPKADLYFEKNFNAKVSPLLRSNNNKKNFLYELLKKKNVRSSALARRYDELSPYIEKLHNSDMVLSLGGDNYSDDYGPADLFWDLGVWAKKMGKPFIIWGASVGPFKSEISLKLALDSLKYIDFITAREQSTVDYLNSIGYQGELIKVCDSAFCLNAYKVDLPKFDRNADLVGFNISPLYHKYTDGKTSQYILDEALKFLEHISKDYNVLLIPHVVIENPDHNDHSFMEGITKGIDNVFLCDKSFDSRELKFVISKCNYFIGARTHATIAAFSEKVPTLSLGYSQKARGLNQDLFGSHEYLLEAADFSSINLINSFNYLVENRLKAVAALETAIPKYKSAIISGIDLVKRLAKNK